MNKPLSQKLVLLLYMDYDSIVAAVILRYLEEGLKQNLGHKKMCDPFLNISLLPGIASTVPTSPTESWGVCRTVAFIKMIRAHDNINKKV
jgi:hypothetical protein